jgi:hypothetical protein
MPLILDDLRGEIPARYASAYLLIVGDDRYVPLEDVIGGAHTIADRGGGPQRSR